MSRTRTAAVTLVLALAASPAFAQQSGQSPSMPSSQSQSGGQQDVQQQDLQKYVQALQKMSQFEPGIQQAIEQGQPVDPSVLNRVPQEDARKAIEEAGLSTDEFRFITKKLNEDPSVKQQFQQMAQQQSQQGGSQSGSSQSGGAQPSQSPQ